MLWFGLILIALAGLLVWLAKRAADKVLFMRATETTKLGTLFETIKQVRDELGGGPSELREYVELKGTVRCDQPLKGELSGQAAAVVETSVVRETEFMREDRDANGRVTQRWETRSESVHQTSLKAPFVLDDGTGQIEVRADGADFTLQQVVDRFEAPNSVEAGGSMLRFGSFQVGFGGGYGGYGSMGSNYRVKGYRFRESILPVGGRVYALGEIADTDEGLSLHKPTAAKEGETTKPYVLSVKSEEELVAAGQQNAKWLKIGGIASAVIGLVLAVVGLVQRVL
jgi:hypothetical protein